MSSSGHVMRTVVEAHEQGGQIPQELINEKYRESSYFHDPEMVKNYQMNSMKVWGTEKPFSEQDRVRENVQTKNIIDSRIYGSRYGTITPDHSEMNFELTEKDPRGCYNIPLFSLAQYHSDYRKGRYLYQFAPDGSVNNSEDRVGLFEQMERFQQTRDRYKQSLTIFEKSLTNNTRMGLIGKDPRKTLKDYVTSEMNMELLNQIGDECNIPSKIFNVNTEPKYGLGSIIDNRFQESGLGLTRQVKLRDYQSAITDADVDQLTLSAREGMVNKAMVLNMDNKMSLKKNLHLDQEELKHLTTTNSSHTSHQKVVTDEDKSRLKAIKELNDTITQMKTYENAIKPRGNFINYSDSYRQGGDNTTKDTRTIREQQLNSIKSNKLFEKNKSSVGASLIAFETDGKTTQIYKRGIRDYKRPNENYNKDGTMSIRRDDVTRLNKGLVKTVDININNYKNDQNLANLSNIHNNSNKRKLSTIASNSEVQGLIDTEQFDQNMSGSRGGTYSKSTGRDGSSNAGGFSTREGEWVHG